MATLDSSVSPVRQEIEESIDAKEEIRRDVFTSE